MSQHGVCRPVSEMHAAPAHVAVHEWSAWAGCRSGAAAALGSCPLELALRWARALLQQQPSACFLQTGLPKTLKAVSRAPHDVMHSLIA